MGGIEAITFGVLVFVGGILLAGSAWSVVDAKLATTAAAREAARLLVESDDGAAATGAAHVAVRRVLAEHGRDPARAEVVVTGSFRRCGTVRVEVSYPVPAVVLPGAGGVGPSYTVRARHAERMDPYRSGPAGEAACGLTR